MMPWATRKKPKPTSRIRKADRKALVESGASRLVQGRHDHASLSIFLCAESSAPRSLSGWVPRHYS